MDLVFLDSFAVSRSPWAEDDFQESIKQFFE